MSNVEIECREVVNELVNKVTYMCSFPPAGEAQPDEFKPVEDNMCSICLENMDSFNTNYIATSCNHAFHSTCFLQHASHNGIGCPLCRDKLVEPLTTTTSSDDDEEEDWGDSESDDDDDEDIYDNEFALRGIRWMFARNDSDPAIRAELEVPLTEEEAEEEGEYISDGGISNDSFIDSDVPEEYPGVDEVSDYLSGLNVSYKDLVISLLATNWEEIYGEKTSYRNTDTRVYCMMDRFISNHFVSSTRGNSVADIAAQEALDR